MEEGERGESERASGVSEEGVRGERETDRERVGDGRVRRLKGESVCEKGKERNCERVGEERRERNSDRVRKGEKCVG